MYRGGHAIGGRALTRLCVAMIVASATLAMNPGPAHAADTIEARHKVPPTNPWQHTWVDGSGTGDCATNVAPPNPYTMVYPTALGAFGVDHPVVFWANGTSTSPNPTCFYEEGLRLLASWGFVVVAANTGQAGSGNEIGFAAAAMVNENNNPSSIFYQKLDTAHFAAVGHSQGAVGAVNAVRNSPDSLFAGVAVISLPDREDLAVYNLTCNLPSCTDVPVPPVGATNDLDAPIFFSRGTGTHHSPSCDDWWADKTAQDWYPSVASGAPMAAGTVRVVQPSPVPSCGPFDVPYPHFMLADLYGYVNAWLVYTLDFTAMVPATARAAFVGSPPEITTNTPKWQGITLRNLP
jgi:hypothetical protein